MSGIKIAVVGAGDWGKNLIRNFAELKTLYSVCDHYMSSVIPLARKYNIPINTWEQILANQDITAVVIATQANTHYELAHKALSAGKHVFVEKPMALCSKDAFNLCQLAKQVNRKLMSGHLLQYHPAFTKLKSMIENGALGKLRYIYSNRLNLGKIYPGKDVLWDLAPHDLSMILSLTNTVPVNVTYNSSNCISNSAADFSMLHLEFEKEIKAHVFVSWLNPVKEQKLVVVGDKAMAVFDDLQEWSHKISIYPHRIEWHDNCPVALKEEAEYIDIPPSEPLRNECKHFVDCILHDKQPITDGYESLRILKVLEQSSTGKLQQDTLSSTQTTVHI
jgi:UDP-2-acetamido-3-amino-2,3-dideoxy-glucuronate N-acetyltransferase